MAVSTTIDPGMFSGLTNKELRVLGAKLDHGGLAAGDRLFPDRNMENEILALSAEVHELAQRSPGPGMDAEWEAEAGQ